VPACPADSCEWCLWNAGAKHSLLEIECVKLSDDFLVAADVVNFSCDAPGFDAGDAGTRSPRTPNPLGLVGGDHGSFDEHHSEAGHRKG
jgi:hypothetical protein